jgi:hypothetical protein
MHTIGGGGTGVVVGIRTVNLPFKAGSSVGDADVVGVVGNKDVPVDAAGDDVGGDVVCAAKGTPGRTCADGGAKGTTMVEFPKCRSWYC